MIRTFIAIEIPSGVRKELEKDLADLRRAAPRVKWSRGDNLHLTLAFLGNVPEKDMGELFDSLREDLAEMRPFALEISGIGVFPHWGCPRVVWAGCGEGSEDATQLGGTVKGICAALGYNPERRPFRPHITLGRVKLLEDASSLRETAKRFAGKSYGFMDADRVSVFMSQLRRTGPVYVPMAAIDLGQSGPG
ncbi:MAG: RNA 2',3'-cyclic phosphodiesterase [Planctomycetota bacterium]|nr:RNA 2',3'-cyclic phosphodiesterase [Planctomycetota bacterium]